MAELAPIVVRVDGSPRALEAARWAGSLAARIGAPLQIMNATPFLVGTKSSATKGAVALAPPRAGAGITQGSIENAVQEEFPQLVVTATGQSGSIGGALVAASRTARLVVVDCHDVNIAAALLRRSTTLGVIDGSSCPVVAWRGSSTHVTTKPIMVGIDVSATADAVLETAFDLADELEVPLRVIHAWSGWRLQDDMALPHLIDLAFAPPTSSESEVAQWKLLNRRIDPLRERHPHVNVTLLGLPGRPNRALLEHIDDAQLVVTGRRRRKALSRWVFGSTSVDVLHHSKVPVVLCPL